MYSLYNSIDICLIFSILFHIKYMLKHYSLDILDYMINNEISIPPEYNQVIDEHFWELTK